jgi:hypothetical protein
MELSITKFCDSIHFLEFQARGWEGSKNEKGKQVTRPQPVYYLRLEQVKISSL